METLTHGITPVMKGLILQPRATGLTHNPATTTTACPNPIPIVVAAPTHQAPTWHPQATHPRASQQRPGLGWDKDA